MTLKDCRKKTRRVKVGKLLIGGTNKIIVQSMCNTDTKNIKATVNQIKKLEDLGCELVRVSVPDIASAKAISKIKSRIEIPLAADIHFDYKLALEAVNYGADKIRINPGNIGGRDKVELIADACNKKNIPIRVGVNAGSLKALRNPSSPPFAKRNKMTISPFNKGSKKQLPSNNPLRWTAEKWAEIMVNEALEHIGLLESLDFRNIIVSLKADDVYRSYLACKLFAKRSDYPQHIGITESGSFFTGTIKSAVGLSRILTEGIGDTIRVSLADNPLKEISVAFEILKSLGLCKYGPEIIACPTCARCEIDVAKITRLLENKIFTDKILRQSSEGLKIAVMGCVVNGPGEAKTADLGVTGTKNYAVLFKKGKIVKKLQKNKLLPALMTEIKKFK